MIQVEQTILTAREGGNCLPACIASVLEVPLESVPHPTPEESVEDAAWQSYYNRLNKWLKGFNLTLVCIADPDRFRPSGYAILGARSPRDGWLHAVVWHEDRIVWDPHPDRAAGVGEWHDWLIFQTLDPSRPASHV